MCVFFVHDTEWIILWRWNHDASWSPKTNDSNFVPFYFKQDSDGDQDADLSTSTLQNTVTEGESTLVVDDPDSKQSLSDTPDRTACTGKSLEKDAAVAADKEEEGSLPWKAAFSSLIDITRKLMLFYRWQISERCLLKRQSVIFSVWYFGSSNEH